MVTASAPTLRPLSMGQILDQGIRLYRRNFFKFIAIIAVVQIPLTLLQMLISVMTVSRAFSALPGPIGTITIIRFDSGYFLRLLGSLVVALVSFVLVWGVAAAALTRAVADQYLGEAITFLEAYRRIRKYLPRLVKAVLFLIVLLLGFGIWTIVPCIGWFTGMGILAFFSAAIMPLIAPIIVIEGQQPIGAVRRAWDLVRRRFWWVVGIVAILYLFNLLIVGGPGMLIGLALQTAAGRLIRASNYATMLIAQTIITTLSSLILTLIYQPLQLTCLTLLYFDLRVRTEGFDLALLAARTLPEPVDPAALAAQTVPPQAGNLVTGKEMGYFALISLGAVALAGILYGILTVLYELLYYFAIHYGVP